MKGRWKKELTTGSLAAALGAAALFARKVTFSQWAGFFSDSRDIGVAPFAAQDILLWLGFSAAAFLVLRLILFLSEKRPPKEVPWKPVKSLFGLFFILILLAQIPCLLTYFPGGVYADTIPSLQIARGEAPLSNRHPILYAFYWMVFVKPGQWLGLSDTLVYFLHTLSVAVFYALTAAWFLSVARRHGASRVLVLLMTAYLALFPLIPLYVVSLWKDTPFSIAAFAFSTFLLDVFWGDSGAWLLQRRRIALYALLAFLFSFLRNNAIYAFVLFSLAAFLHYLKTDKRAARRFGILSLALVVPFCILRGAISSSAESVESLGIPLQQVGYVLDEGGKISEEDLAFLDRILPVERWKEVYRPLYVDPVKWDDAFDKAFFREHTGEFLRVWLRIVRDNFPSAVKSYLISTVGFWDPTRQMTHGYICNTMWEGEDLPEMHDLPAEWTGVSLAGFYEGLPLMSAALFAWIVLVLTVLGTLRHRRPTFMAVLPALGIWLTVLIATPIAFSLRYLFPCVLLVPLAFVIFFQGGSVKQQ